MRESVARVRHALPTLPSTFVWFAAVVCLVVMPAVVGSLRLTSYEASISVDVYTNDRRLADRVEHVEAVVASPGIASAIAAASKGLIHPETIIRRIDVSSENRVIVLTAEGTTPAQAQELANTAGAVLKTVSRNQIYPIRRAVAPAPEPPVDRVLALVPGRLPPPPHPIFSAAVGFVIALLVYVGWRRRFEDGRESPGRGRVR